MNVVLVQMNVMHCKKDHNLERALGLVSHNDADIIVLPEVFSTGFCYERIGELAESDPFPTLERLEQVSKDKCAIIIGSFITRGPGEKFYNTGFVLDNGELTGTYHKIHPFGTEKDYFISGDAIAPIRTSRGSVGLMICYDVRFPEVARKLALEGADILVTVAKFPSIRQEHWDILIKARAIENQIPHLACNCTGSDPFNDFLGRSAVIDGWGRTLAGAGSGEELIIASIDMDESARIREVVPCFRDRREELY